MDALSEILRDARLTGGIFLRASFSEPWGLASAVTASDCSPHLGATDHLVLFHYVMDGTLHVTFDGTEPKLFLPGQAAIFPRNDRHTLSGRQFAKAVSPFDASTLPSPGELLVIEHGGGGASTRIICGFLGGRLMSDDPLFAALPPLLTYDCEKERAGGLVQASFEHAANELAAGRPGVDAMLARLSELLFVEAVRSHVEGLGGEAVGFFAALRDRALSRALALVHKHPERAWTVTELAREAGASRSSLTDKFQQHLSHAPMAYLTRHRMRLAANALEMGTSPILAIAESVGYGSEAAFSRAFKQAKGVSPTAWRTQYRSTAEQPHPVKEK